MIWRVARVSLLLLSAALIYHGFFGPDFAPKNLTTLFIWVHYRGLLILAALFLGNFFCGACPAVFLRNILRRFRAPTRAWPLRLKNKWPAILLFVAVLLAYEKWALWGSPAATAGLIVLFFGLCLSIDLVYKEASFCKYVCPVGQFNFLTSMISPRSVQARDLSACRTCKTLDCIKGSIEHRGCELKLFVPKKVGGMNCTLCMDCQTACPKNNVVLSRVQPGDGLFAIRGSWLRSDLVALQIVFIFGALANAFAMTPPAQTINQWAGHSATALLGVFFVFLVVIPILVASAHRLWRTATKAPHVSSAQFWPALIPLGVSVWAAHYLFHFLTGALTFLPVAWSVLRLPELPLGAWTQFPMGLSVAVVEPIQLGLLALGLILTLVTLDIRARKVSARAPLLVQIPWVAASLILTAFAAWILTMPMDMRGTFVGG